MDNQMLLFALDTQTSDKMQEHLANLRDKPVLTFSNCWQESTNQKFQYLDVRTNDTKVVSDKLNLLLQGAPSQLNYSESPTNEIKSYLSQILQQGEIPDKYYLSSLACAGILRRAESRGKELPDILRLALQNQVNSPITDKSTETYEDED